MNGAKKHFPRASTIREAYRRFCDAKAVRLRQNQQLADQLESEAKQRLSSDAEAKSTRIDKQFVGWVDSGAERQKWQAIRDALQIYLQSDGQEKDAVCIEILPKEMTFEIWFVLEELLAGRRSEALDSLTRRGNPARLPSEESDIECAVLYIKAARARLFQEKAPVTTICREFRVKSSTVRMWQRTTSKAATDPTRLRPNWPTEDRVKLIKSLMLTSAKRYRLLARSSARRLEKKSEQTSLRIGQ